MQKLYKKDVKQFISIFVKNLDIGDYCDVRTKIEKYLKENKMVGLVSDRGTPIISDPGCELVKIVIDNGFNVVSLPGPTALIPALTSSGLDASSFTFIGFLDAKEGKWHKQL